MSLRMSLRDTLIELLKNHSCIPYDERLGDTSNPDYIGPEEISEIVNDILKAVSEYIDGQRTD